MNFTSYVKLFFSNSSRTNAFTWICSWAKQVSLIIIVWLSCHMILLLFNNSQWLYFETIYQFLFPNHFSFFLLIVKAKIYLNPFCLTKTNEGLGLQKVFYFNWEKKELKVKKIVRNNNFTYAYSCITIKLHFNFFCFICFIEKYIFCVENKNIFFRINNYFFHKEYLNFSFRPDRDKYVEVKEESVSGNTHTIREEFGEMNQEIIIFYFFL